MKYFITSDIHSFYTPLMSSLNSAGFDKNNPEHILVVCGDVFDRGDETLEVYTFLKTLPKDRCILIRGNHEQLFLELLKKDYPEGHDFSNGTVKTFCAIANIENTNDKYFFKAVREHTWYTEIDQVAQSLWYKVRDAVKNSAVTKWLKSKQWINYFELDKYIFTHSFIPLIFKSDRGLNEDYCIYYGWVTQFEERPDWRNATNEEWTHAAWGCAYMFFDAGLFDQEIKKGKVLVCGHYRCSEFNEHYLDTGGYNIYYGKNLIALDATTALSLQCNVMIYDTETKQCFDQNQNLLIEKQPVPSIETVTLEGVPQ